jgi:large subunit ribosomal protein L2
MSKTAPLAEILLENQKKITLIAPEGVRVGDWIDFGDKTKQTSGNVLPLNSITEGTAVYNIEVEEGDGGKLVRSSGASASVVSQERQRGITYVRMPSKKVVQIKNTCRATIGEIAAAGRKEKPFVHAGQLYHRYDRLGKLYPIVKGKAMNSIDHPHGGGRHPHLGRPTTVARNTPPGRKVGQVAARRTGKRKK